MRIIRDAAGRVDGQAEGLRGRRDIGGIVDKHTEDDKAGSYTNKQSK